jgi:glycosyltransferase involved in cell wall biosynthesis
MQDLVKQKGLEKNVMFISDYLEVPQIVKTLQLADVIILPYGEVVEGASGAVRTVISANRPIVVTDSYIFDSLPIGIKIHGNKPATIAKYTKALLQDSESYLKEKYEIKKYAANQSWDEVVIKYLKVLAE